MKKFLVALLVTASFSASAQQVTRTDSIYKPYVNVGTTIGNGVLSYGGELGVYNINSWYAVGVSSTTASPENVWSLSAKGYWKISNRHQLQKVDVFASGAINMVLITDHPISIEPGLAAVFNVNSKIAPQVSLSFPIEQNAVFRNRALAINAGLSLNYWF